MRQKKLFYLLFLLFFQLDAGAQISSTFGTNADGWTAFDANLGASNTPTFNATGGNPGGNISFTTSSGSVNFFWYAPAKFKGNQSKSYDQILTFDLNVSTTGTDNLQNDLFIQGNGYTLVYQLPAKPVTGSWTTYTVQLNESFAGWHLGSYVGTAPSKEQVKAALANVTTFGIRLKYLAGNTGPYTGSLDNVILDQPALITPPVITSFTPTSALKGTTITINGNNFNVTAAQNTVYFGGIKATVLSATATKLTATLPGSTPYGHITVINLGTGLQGTSAQNFNALYDNNKDYGGQIIRASMLQGYNTILPMGTNGNTFGNMDKGDFDGDGWIDLVATETSSSKIYVFRNVGTGGSVGVSSFASPLILTATGIPSGSPNIGELKVADIDSDGKLDISCISSSAAGGFLAVFRNTTSASMSFANAVFSQYPYYSSQLSTTAGDLDADGRVDFLYTTGTSPGGIWYQRNLSTPGNVDFEYGVEFGTNIGHSDIVVGDLDSNGFPEVIASSGNKVEIYENTSTAGATSFKAPFSITETSCDYVAIGDLDTDNKPDLIWSAYGAQYIYMARNNYAGVLDATVLGTAVAIPNKLADPHSIDISDINSDGKADIVISGSSDVGILQNIGTSSLNTNSFMSPVVIQGSKSGNAVTGQSPVMADLDGDNKPEIAFVYANSSLPVGEHGLYIFHNECFPVPVVNSFSPTSGSTGNTVTLTGDLMKTGNTTPVVRLSGTLASVTANSNTSTSITLPAGSKSGRIEVIEHGLTGKSKPFKVTFNTNKIINSTSFPSSIDFALASNTRDALDVADFDDDGKIDVMATENYGTARIYKNVGTAGQPIALSTLNLETTSYPASYNLVPLDIDGDGKIDLHTGSNLIQNTSTAGAISFNAASATPVSGFIDVAPADFNKDGKIDLAASNGTAFIQVYENKSTKGLMSMSTYDATVTNLSKVSANGGVAGADFDGDNYEDILAINQFDKSISYFLNTKQFGPINASSFNFLGKSGTSGTEPIDLTVADFDGDGKLDIAVANNKSTFVSVYRNTSSIGDINFASPVDIACLTNGYKINSQDLDGDGLAEIVIIHRPNPGPGSFSVLQNQSTVGNISFNAAVNFALSTQSRNPQELTIADINYDGKPDILILGDPYLAAKPAIMIFENKIATGPVITITKQPADATVCEGVTATFDTDASGTTNISYQWQYSPNTGVYTDLADGTSYSGTASKTLTVTTTKSLEGRYRCRVSGDNATPVTTNDEGLFVNIIPSAPTTTGASNCNPSVLTLTASGASNGQFLWYDAPTNGLIGGQINDTYVTAKLTTTATFYASIKINGCESSRTPVLAEIKPLASPVIDFDPIVKDPANIIICGGASETLIVSSSYKSFSWSDGGTSNSTDVTTTGNYSVVVTDSKGCTATSNVVVITANPNPVATITPSGNLLSASSGDSYEWFFEGELIDGATSETLTINIFEYGRYAVLITKDGCSAMSDEFPNLITETESINESIRYYPNPIVFSLTIENTSPEAVNAKIYDHLGQVLINRIIPNGTTVIQTDHISSGLLFLEIGTKSGTVVKKLKKQ